MSLEIMSELAVADLIHAAQQGRLESEIKNKIALLEEDAQQSWEKGQLFWLMVELKLRQKRVYLKEQQQTDLFAYIDLVLSEIAKKGLTKE